jgi:hypothetical protein
MRQNKEDGRLKNRHRKKKDGRFLILLSIIISDVFLTVQLNTLTHPSIGKWVILLVGIGFVIFFSITTYPAYCEITSSALIVRSGMRYQVILLTSIQKVYPSHFVPGAKWPLNQLRVDYRLANQSSLRPMFVAPEDETKFLHDLGERARNVDIVITPF